MILETMDRAIGRIVATLWSGLCYASWNPTIAGGLVIVGAVITVWGAFILEHRQRRNEQNVLFNVQDRQRLSEQKAAGRALLAEMQFNSKSLRNYSRDQSFKFLCSTSVWITTLPLVAQLLAWRDVEKIVRAYLFA